MIEELLLMLIGAVLTGLGVTIGGLVIRKASSRIKWESPDMTYLKGQLEKLDNGEKQRAREVHALFQLQEPQLKALIVLMQAMRDGHTNGNVDAAIREIQEAQKRFHDFLVEGVGCE